MSDFALYFKMGMEHIADFAAYDHMLFIVSLCALFSIKDWKKVLILVTAFTIGHSVTLALSVLDLVKINSELIETLIPITIILTSLLNIIQLKSKVLTQRIWIHYVLALSFGLIHGLGFANYLKSLLMGMGSLLIPLFSFNLGIEIGQIAIVLCYLFITLVIVQVLKVKKNLLTWLISILCIVISLYLIFIA